MLNCSLPCPQNILSSLCFTSVFSKSPLLQVLVKLCNLQGWEFPCLWVAIYAQINLLCVACVVLSRHSWQEIQMYFF